MEENSPSENDGHVEEIVDSDDTADSAIQKAYSDLRESVAHPNVQKEIASNCRRLSLLMTANREQPKSLAGVILFFNEKNLHLFSLNIFRTKTMNCLATF